MSNGRGGKRFLCIHLSLLNSFCRDQFLLYPVFANILARTKTKLQDARRDINS